MLGIPTAMVLLHSARTTRGEQIPQNNYHFFIRERYREWRRRQRRRQEEGLHNIYRRGSGGQTTARASTSSVGLMLEGLSNVPTTTGGASGRRHGVPAGRARPPKKPPQDQRAYCAEGSGAPSGFSRQSYMATFVPLLRQTRTCPAGTHTGARLTRLSRGIP